MEPELTWKQRNREYWNQYSKDWRKKRKEELGDFWTIYNSKWRTTHPKKYLLSKAKRHAEQRNLEFNLTEKDIEIPEVCPVLGIPLIIQAGKGKTNNSPSIDRIDSSKGYVKGNVNVVSWRANDLKANGTLEEFRSLVQWLENG